MDGRLKRSSISVCYILLTDAELDEALEVLANEAQPQKVCGLFRPETICVSLSKFSFPYVPQFMHLTEDNTSKSESLKEMKPEYFCSDNCRSSNFHRRLEKLKALSKYEF